jgi:hypothetical protein
MASEFGEAAVREMANITEGLHSSLLIECRQLRAPPDEDSMTVRVDEQQSIKGVVFFVSNE